MLYRFTITVVASVMLTLCIAPPAEGQAYCKLRDPVRQIYELFPDATSYQTVVRTIDEQTREATERELPFSIHFNELGRHTLYIVLEGQVPVGLVHVRSEVGRWGLVEVAWALTLDLKVIDFRFQRCRDSAREDVSGEALKSQIIGHGFDEIKALLREDGALDRDRVTMPGGAGENVAELFTTIVRSALKTIVVTRAAWADDLQVARWIHVGLAAFPDGHSVEKVDHVYREDDLLDRLESAVGNSTGIDRASTVALLIKNEEGEKVGMTIWTDWSMQDHHAAIWWAVSGEPQIDALVAETPWPDEKTETAFLALKGKALRELYECQTAAELAGHEVLILAQAWLGERVERTAEHAD